MEVTIYDQKVVEDIAMTHSKKTRLLPADQVRLPCSKPEKMVVTANNDSDYYKV